VHRRYGTQRFEAQEKIARLIATETAIGKNSLNKAAGARRVADATAATNPPGSGPEPGIRAEITGIVNGQGAEIPKSFPACAAFTTIFSRIG
jgi:hypothetical protein